MLTNIFVIMIVTCINFLTHIFIQGIFKDLNWNRNLKKFIFIISLIPPISIFLEFVIFIVGLSLIIYKLPKEIINNYRKL